jgi:uncharacterized protein YdaL
MAHFPTPYNLPKNNDGKYSRNDIEKAFEAGANHQAERIPSIINEYLETAFISIEEGYMNPIKWFEQFKKK